MSNHLCSLFSMGNSSELLKRTEVKRLLYVLGTGLVDRFNPEFSSNGATYPNAMMIMKLPSKQTKDVLDSLAKEGILIKTLEEIRISCPSCASSKLSLRPECPNCSSSLLRKGMVIEHLICGYIDFAEHFMEPEGLTCPKCRRSLKSLGLDYRKPGSFYKCQSCGEFTSNIKKRYMCGECGCEFLEGEEFLMEAYVYRVNEQKKHIIGFMCIDLKPVIEKLKSVGWEVSESALIEGTSGVKHTFTFAAWMSGRKTAQSKPDLVTDIIIGEKLADETVVLSTIAKALDIRVKRIVLVAVPGLSDQAKKLAKFYNLQVSECLNSGLVSNALEYLFNAPLTLPI